MGVKHAIRSKRVVNVWKRKAEKPSRAGDPEDADVNPRNTEDFLLTHVLRPPYSIILDTNFINDCVRKKYDIKEQLMRTVNSSVKMLIPECVVGELEKLGRPFRVALASIRDGEVERLECDHKGTYADDCIFNRVSAHRCYIVATSDTALRQRIKTLPGVPLITYRGQRCFIERFIPATF